TTLVVSLLSDQRVQWASIGDSIACVAAPGEARMLFSPNRRFLGYPVPPGNAGLPGIAPFMSYGASRLPEGAWVILATDGYSDWAPGGHDLASATALWTAGARDAATI